MGSSLFLEDLPSCLLDLFSDFTTAWRFYSSFAVIDFANDETNRVDYYYNYNSITTATATARATTTATATIR